MMLRFFFILIAISLYIFSCTTTSSEKDNNRKEINDEQVEINSKNKDSIGNGLNKSKIEETLVNDKVEYIDSTTQADLEVLHSQYNKAPYYFEKENKRYYYIVKGYWPEDNSYGFKTGSFQMGIVDENKELILPVAYDKIFSPDVLKANWVEVQKGNKTGLFNYKTKALIPCEYEYFFLSMQSPYVAFGYRDKENWGILESGEAQKLDDKLSFKDYVGNWSYTVSNNYKPLLIDSYMKINPNEQDVGKGISFTPSFLHSLNIFPEIENGYITRESEDIGTQHSSSMITSKKEVSSGITAFFTKFYSYGVSAREDELEQHHILTLDSENNKIDKQELLNISSKPLPFCKYEKELRFVNDSIFQVKYFSNKIEDNIYDEMTAFRFFEVNKNGKIIKLDADRIFDFTKYIIIDESYLSGCYLKFLKWKNESTDDVVYYDHLNVEDLELMVNEIYAEYGYKFKSEKWRNYFKNKDWYKGVYDNVDDQLSEIEKENIKIISAVKERLIHDHKIIKESKGYWGFPG